jgi:iduronate 2-sulfatase
MKYFRLIVFVFMGVVSCNQPGKNGELTRPNILFIVFDDLGRHLSSYNDPNAIKFNLTPNFDRLAEMGVQFNNAYCQVPVCGPSRASFLTGLRPDYTTVNTDHDMEWVYNKVNTPGFFKIIKSHPTMLNYFREHGYYTARSGKIHHGFGITRSIEWEPTDYEKEPDAIPLLSPAEFAEYTDHSGLPGLWQDPENPILKDQVNPWEGPHTHKLTTIWEMHMDYDKDDPYRNRNALWVHRTLHAIDKAVKQDKPFFISCGIVANHDPYCQPKEFADKIDPREIILPETNGLKNGKGRPVPWVYYQGQRRWSDGTANWPSLDDYLMRRNIPDKPWEGEPLPGDPGDIAEEAIRRKMLQSYYASVNYSDYLLGKLMDKLEEHNIMDNTIIAVISDHGFHIFDHDIWNKTTQFRYSTRTIAFMHAPGVITNHNAKIDQPVELLDFYPTLADLCGLELPATMHGKSLIPLLKNPGESVETYAFSQFDKNRQMGYSINNPQYRYSAWLDNTDGKGGEINSGPEYGEIMMEELYDLEQDPQEIDNIAGSEEYKEIQKRLKTDLMEFVRDESLLTSK